MRSRTSWDPVAPVHGGATRDGRRLDRPLAAHVASGLRGAHGFLTVRCFDRPDNAALRGCTMKLRLLVVALLAPLAVSALVVSSALAGDDPKDRTKERLRGVNFVSSCTFTHRAPDDPIVFFGKPGASHDHSFVGNTSTNASSTLASLLAAGTTCHRAGDTAAYWMPTLLQNGQPVMPVHAQIYYRRSTQRHVEAFPPGFRMIAGDAKATAAQARRITFWNCGVAGGVRASTDVPSCPNARRAASPPPRDVPELLGRQEPRQREPPEPRGATRSPAAARLATRTRSRRSR